MNQMQVGFKYWGILLFYLEVHFPNCFLLIKDGRQRRACVALFSSVPFQRVNTGPLFFFSQAVNVALWNVSQIRLK